jgi:hypothetical protein
LARKPERRGTVGAGPTFWLIGLEKICECGVALTSRLQSFETALLTPADNLAGLTILNRELIAQAEVLAGTAAGANNGWARKPSSGPTAFATPELDAALEKHNGKYAVRVPPKNRGTQRQGVVDPAGSAPES